jgi:hypothetical protein
VRALGVFMHRHAMAFIRYSRGMWGSDSARPDAEEVSYWQARWAEEVESFRVKREGAQGTRRKPDVICSGRNGVISVAELLNFTDNPQMRTLIL